MNLKSESGIYYYAYNGSKFVLLKENEQTTVQPFESFIVISTATPNLLKSFISYGERDLTSIDSTIAPERKIVKVLYYNMQGIRISAPIEKEVYIEKAIYESREEVVTKIVNSKK